MLGFLKSSQLGIQICRNYAFKSDLKIKWVRPDKISCILPERSGDNGELPKLDTKEFIPGFQDCKELVDADENVKCIFTLEHNRRVHTSNLFRELFIKEVQRHPLDYGSMEAKTKMTATIRRFQEYMIQYPRNKKMKVQLKEMIDKRKKFLKILRRWDYKKFEWLLEKLDLVYKPPPAEFHWITRKDSLVKLTNQHCENVRNERLNEYRKHLESQQVEFLEKKLKNLEFIRKEQQECLVKQTISEDDLEIVRTKIKLLKNTKNKLDENEQIN